MHEVKIRVLLYISNNFGRELKCVIMKNFGLNVRLKT